MGNNPGWEAIYAEIHEAEEKAKQGDVNAMIYTAHLYNNRGDFSSSLSWYEKAAEAGSAEAMHQIGMWRKYHNLKEAAVWFRKAAALGHERSAEEAANYDGAIKRLTEIVGESAESLTLTWDDAGKIAGILDKKFPRTDVLSLTNDKLMSMMLEAGIRQILPASSWPGERDDDLLAIKGALTRVIEGEGGSECDARQGDAYV